MMYNFLKESSREINWLVTIFKQLLRFNYNYFAINNMLILNDSYSQNQFILFDQLF